MEAIATFNAIPPFVLDATDFPVRKVSRQKAWGVVLAGGDGLRLRSLSRVISGDDRPKQFCPIFGDRTLLAQTRARLAGSIDPERTLFVVTKAHEKYYREELCDVHPSQIIAQPANRGTGAAIACALMHILERDPDAVVAFFPSDHFYSNEERFRASVESAVQTAAEWQDSLVLMGAEATHPETEYGWIEPGRSAACDFSGSLYRVSRFWEKPSFELAQSLQRQGCLWNTFVMMGQVDAFLHLLESAVPELLDVFLTARQHGRPEDAYMREDFTPVDFSKQVLAHSAARLLVARMPASVGWSDLGAPERVMTTLMQAGMESRHRLLRAWHSTGTRTAESATAVA